MKLIFVTNSIVLMLCIVDFRDCYHVSVICLVDCLVDTDLTVTKINTKTLQFNKWLVLLTVRTHGQQVLEMCC